MNAFLFPLALLTLVSAIGKHLFPLFTRAFLIIVSIVTIVLPLIPTDPKDCLQYKFDRFLESYNSTILKQSPISLTKNQTFTWSSSILVPGKTITGQGIINATFIHGLNDVIRNNSLVAEKTGLHTWRSKGQIVLAAPKIEATLHLLTSSDPGFDSSKLAPLKVITLTNTDIAFDFVATINDHWKQFIFTEFDYNNTFPETATFISNCPPEMVNDCSVNLLLGVKNFFRLLSVDVKNLAQYLIQSVPFN